MDKRSAIIVAVITGVALELGIHALTGRREAWDSPTFWTLGVPLAMVVAVAIGYLARGANWVWAWLICPAQVTTMMLEQGEILIWPLLMVLAGVLGVPFLVVAFVASKFRPAT